MPGKRLRITACRVAITIPGTVFIFSNKKATSVKVALLVIVI